MNRRGGILLATVLAFSAMFRANLSGPSNAQTTAAQRNSESNRARASVFATSPEESRADGAKFQIGELNKGVGEFFEVNSPTARSLQYWNVPQPSNVEFLIATLADPVHTHLALYFDRQIEAIQLAAQARHYIFDRAVLPWDNKVHPESDNFLLRANEGKWQEGREDYPGLLIFRPAPEDQREVLSPLFVFVVGETPTGGIHKKEFLNALNIIYAMRGNSIDQNLRLLGPTFSGSFYSLHKLLSADNTRIPSQIYAYTGVVSGWHPAEWFQKEMAKHPHGRNVQFVSFQESDRYQLRRLIEFLENQGYSPHDIAVLSEDETQYGGTVNAGALRAPFRTPPGFCQKNAAQMNQCENSVLQLYFPREIAHLRAAYQQDIYGDEDSDHGDKRVPRSSLKLDMENVGSDDDTVASYSHKQMPLSQEAVLLGIVRALREHKSAFVVLKATDPIDRLFLARFLRKAYGEVRIVTFGADLIFHREDDDMLTGVLSLTPYYLMPGIHGFFSEKSGDLAPRVDRIFSSSLSIGNYNAMLALLAKDRAVTSPSCQPGRINCECEKLPDVPYEQYSWPVWPPYDAKLRNASGCWRTPPLWLMAVGRGGYWPLAILNPLNRKTTDELIATRIHTAESETPADLPKGHHIHRSWELLCGLWILAAFAHLLFLRQGSLLARSEMLARFAPVQDWRRSVVLAAASTLLLSGVLLLLHITPTPGWQYILNITVVFLILAPTLDLDRRGTPRTAIAYYLISILLVFLMARVFGFLQGDEPFWHLVIFRSVHITSAVSPLLPIMLLIIAGYWWAWHNLSGVSFLDHRRPHLPECQEKNDPRVAGLSSKLPPVMVGISQKEAERLVRVARPFGFDTRILFPIVFLLLVLVFCFTGSRRPIQSLEGRLYDVIYAVLVAVFVLALLVNLLRLMVVWIECRRLLLALERLPLRRAFSRLKGFSWKPIWRLGGSGIRDSYNLVSRQFESIAHLQNALEEKTTMDRFDNTGPIKKTLQELMIKRDEITAAYMKALDSEARDKLLSNPKPTQQIIEQFRELQKKIAGACGVVLNFLMTTWAKETGLVAVDIHGSGKNESSHGDTKTEQPSQPAFIALAEEFVALVYVNFILHFLLRIRTFVLCVSGMFVLILASLNTYPFEPRSALHSIMIGLFILIGIVVATVYAEMHKNATLSHVTDTTPGELGLDFWTKIAAFGAIPLLSLLAAQFPEVNRFLFSWLQPAMEAVK